MEAGIELMTQPSDADGVELADALSDSDDEAMDFERYFSQLTDYAPSHEFADAETEDFRSFLNPDPALGAFDSTLNAEYYQTILDSNAAEFVPETTATYPPELPAI